MGDDHTGPTSHRRRRSGIDSVSGKCVVCASSIVAGIAGVGLSWLAASGPQSTAAPTRFGEIKLVDASDPLAAFENLTIILPGADDTVVLPSDNVINLPFGGDGLNNFFGPGEAGTAGGAADTATQTWGEFTTPVEQITIPILNDTIVLPGSNDTFFYLGDLLSGNEINLPFFGGGENDFFGYVFAQPGTAGSGVSSVETAGTAGSLPSAGADSIPSNAIVLPGSADTIFLPSFNTINLPFGGDGENNFGGGGSGGDGGVGTGIGIDGNSTASAGETAATAASSSDVSADTAGTGNATFLSGAGQTILFPSNNTINFPFGGDDENNFLGGGDGGDGGDGTGIGIGGTGDNVTGIGIGIGGNGGNGGDGAQFFPVQINFVDSSGASAVTVVDSSASSSDSSSESLDDFLAGILGSNGSSEVSDATGTAIGIGANGGDGGSGAVIGAMDYNVNTAELSTTQSASLNGFLDSLLGSSDSTAVAGQVGSTITDGTSVSINGSGGAGGSAAEFFPITLDWADSAGAHTVTVTPVVLFDDAISYFGASAADSTSSAGDLGDVLGSNLSTLMADLSSLF